MAGFGDQSLNHSANDLLTAQKLFPHIHTTKLAGRERIELPWLVLETRAYATRPTTCLRRKNFFHTYTQRNWEVVRESNSHGWFWRPEPMPLGQRPVDDAKTFSTHTNNGIGRS